MSAQYHHLDSSYAYYQKILSKHNTETVKLYGKILKINKRNKKQQRIFLLTNRAIYNLNPRNNAIKRRIDLLNISSITTSITSTEFSINIPSEYDYHYDAMHITFQNDIISNICQQIANLKHEIFINQINDKSTINWTVTKNALKKINSHYDNIVKSAMALDYLTAMGFKSKTCQKAFKQNKQNLSLTIQSLLHEYIQSSNSSDNRFNSPFVSKQNTPLITTINCNYVLLNDLIATTPTVSNQLGLTPSSTDEANDEFTVTIN
eukprot:100358_1